MNPTTTEPTPTQPDGAAPVFADAAPVNPDGNQEGNPERNSEDDARQARLGAPHIEQRVLTAIRRHPSLEVHSLAVTVNEDGVLLAGAVADARALVALNRCAEGAAPGTPVMNMAVISPAAVRQNVDRAEKLEHEIATALPEADIEVATMGTVVVLRGDASQEDRERAAFMAEHHPVFERAVVSWTSSPADRLASGLKTLRDTVRLKVHLAELEVKDAWEAVEPSLEALEGQLRARGARLHDEGELQAHLFWLEVRDRLEHARSLVDEIASRLKGQGQELRAEVDRARVQAHLARLDSEDTIARWREEAERSQPDDLGALEKVLLTTADWMDQVALRLR